jgi:hypothetical protein
VRGEILRNPAASTVSRKGEADWEDSETIVTTSGVWHRSESTRSDGQAVSLRRGFRKREEMV